MFRPITPVKVLDVANSDDSPWLMNTKNRSILVVLLEQSVINDYGIQEHRVARIWKKVSDITLNNLQPGEVFEGNLIYVEKLETDLNDTEKSSWEKSKFINHEGELVTKEFLGTKIRRYLFYKEDSESTDDLIIPTNYFGDFSFISYLEDLNIDPDYIGLDLVKITTSLKFNTDLQTLIYESIRLLQKKKVYIWDNHELYVEAFTNFFKKWYERLMQTYPPFDIPIVKNVVRQLTEQENVAFMLALKRNMPTEVFLKSSHKNSSANHRLKTKTKGGNKITYGIDYVPLNRDVEATKDIEYDRNFIYSFKNGNYTQKHIQMLENLIDPSLYTLVDGKMKFHEWTVILTIPASSSIIQEKRYMKFYEQFCENKDFLINGYKWVRVEYDREAIHTTESRKLTVNYSIALYMLTTNMLKNIIILDDLVTTGSSINQFMEQLGEYKSKVKQIITFGATV